MIKLISVIGARPQFIKAAPVALAVKKWNRRNPDQMIADVLIHTGQHYDYAMSDVFFEELGIPAPKRNLNAGSGSHAVQTGEILKRLEEALLSEKPDMVMVYGDTNSTLAGALAASKLHIPIAHVEAGLRSYNRRMPEEINRVVTDRISCLLLCPTRNAEIILRREGNDQTIVNTGDVMYDAALIFGQLAEQKPDILPTLQLKPRQYFLATIHRAENTDDPVLLRNIIDGFSQIQGNIILPAHPRLKNKFSEYQFHTLPANIKLIEPVSFLDMIRLERNARKILTDSGGVQKEAYFYQVPCITLRNETEWVETLENGCNQLAGKDPARIAALGNQPFADLGYHPYFGDGAASDRIIIEMVNWLKKKNPAC